MNTSKLKMLEKNGFIFLKHTEFVGDFKIFNTRGTHSWQNVFLIFLQAVSLGTST